MCTMKLYVLLLPLTYIIISIKADDEVNMIVDVVRSFHKPISINAFVSWNVSKKIEFIKKFNSKDDPKTVKFDKEAPEISQYGGKDVIILADLSHPNIKNFLQNVSLRKMFRKPYRWLILWKSHTKLELVPSEIKNMEILIDSEIMVTYSNEHKGFNIDLIYRLRANSDWVLEPYAVWNNSQGLCMSDVMSTSASIRRKNFAMKPLVSTIVVTNKESTKEDFLFHRKKDIDSISKNSFQVILYLYDFMNASKELVFDDTWGYYKNGSWNGMISTLLKGKADLSGAVIYFSLERLPLVEALTAPLATYPLFVFREPPLSYQNNLFLLPFRATVWYCLMAFVLILIGVIYINAIWEKKKSNINEVKAHKNESYELIANFSDAVIFVFGAIFQQGNPKEFKGTLGRCVTFVLLLTFLFLYTSYSASIVALLQSTSNQIRTLSDLLESRLELGVEDTAYNRILFEAAEDPVRKAIYQTKVAPKGSKHNFFTLEEGVRKLQKSPFAFNMDIGRGYKFVERYFYEHEKCGLREIAFIPRRPPYLVCPRNSPLKEIFLIGLLRTNEHGLTQRVNKMVYAKKPTCVVKSGSFGSVNMVDIYPAILTLIYGMVLAVLLLFMEIFVHRRQMNRN